MIKGLRYYILIGILGIAIFFPHINNDFVWDDLGQIVHNEKIHDLKFLPELLKGETFGDKTGELYFFFKPFFTMSYSLIWNLLGEEKIYFHFVQFTFCILNAFFIFFLFSKLYSKNLSLFVSLIFLVHPLNSENAFYIANLQDVLFLTFGLLGFVLNELFKEKKITYFLVPFLFLLSMGFKETGLLFFPLYLAFLLLVKKEKLIFATFSSTLFVCLYFIARFLLFDRSLFTSNHIPIMNASIMERILTIPSEFIYYIKLFIIPFPITIAQHWVIASPLSFNFLINLIFTLLVLFFICFGIYKNRQDKIYIMWNIWLLLTLLFHLNLFPLGFTVATRWFYLPMIGILGLLAHLTLKIKDKFLKKGLISLVIVFILVCSVLTFKRGYDWKNGYTLYSKDLPYMKDTQAFDVKTNFGNTLYERGMRDEACKQYKLATIDSPNWWVSFNNLAICYEHEGNIDLTHQSYQRSLQNGDYFIGYKNYIRFLNNQKSHKLLEIYNKRAKKLFPNQF